MSSVTAPSCAASQRESHHGDERAPLAEDGAKGAARRPAPALSALLTSLRGGRPGQH
jgi:hypothetical protein